MLSFNKRLLGLLLGSVAGRSLFAGTIYNVTPIPLPSGWSSVNSGSREGDINDSGQVTGYGWNGIAYQAFIGDGSGSRAIPVPTGWGDTWTFGINASGQVVGGGWNGTANRPFIGTVDGITPIPLSPEWGDSGASDINDSGQVVGTGWYTHPNGAVYPRAFIGGTGGITILPVPDNCWRMDAAGLNDSGQITGWAGCGCRQAFIGNASGATRIPIGGWTATFGNRINNAGQIAGEGWTSEDNHISQAWIGGAGGVIAIPLLPGWTTSSGYDINDAGEVVGTGDGGGWIWDAANGSRALTDVVPSGWVISNAYGINSKGQIVAYATSGVLGYEGTVRLDPTPEPASWTALAIGLAALASVRRRRT